MTVRLFDENTGIDFRELAGKNIYVISDLHSGDGTARDNFAYLNNGTEFKKCLEYILKTDANAAIVILGDFFEFWQSPFGAVLVNNLLLMDFLAEIKAHYVLGNHDNDLLALLKRKSDGNGGRLLGHSFFDRAGTGTLVTDRGDKRIALLHGHEVDPFNASPVPSTGRALSILAGIVEDKIQRPFLDKTQSVEDALENLGEMILDGLQGLWNTLNSGGPVEFGSPRTPSSRPDLAEKNTREWAGLREAGQFDILVCGHTHRPGRAKDSNGAYWYFNSGCWAKTCNTYLKIDTSGNIEIFEWKGAQAIPHVVDLKY